MNDDNCCDKQEHPESKIAAYMTVKMVSARLIKCAMQGCKHDANPDLYCTTPRNGNMNGVATFYVCDGCYMRIVRPYLNKRERGEVE
jgi:hypothetical protein